MDARLEADILKTCESIGFADEDEKYIAEPDWEVCVKDLILYLRRDDDDHTVRRLLGRTRVLERDLIPLLKHNHKDPKTWDATLRLLSNLTFPALLLYEEEIPKNKTYLNYYNQLEGHLRSYKAAFVDKDFWKILAEKVSQLLEVEFEKRKDSEKVIVERVLLLIRNVLHVAADPAEERRADDDTSLHDRILMVLHLSGIFELLLHTASSDSSHDYSILLLEIMSLMFREQTGEQLAKTQWTRNEEDKIRDERELVRMREKEAVLKNIQLQKLPTRHSRFGGTYVIQDMKAPSGRDLICHKPISSVADLSLDTLKKRKKVASNRRPVNDNEITRRSTIPVRIILKNFCASFLDGKYNRLMSTVRDFLNRKKKEENDETYYLWGLKFFMEFNRNHEFKLSKVSETMSTSTFHYVQTLLDDYQGMMVTDKEKLPFWSKRSHTALKAYQELLFTLLWMDKQGEDERAADKSRSIKASVFYLPEYRELLLGLLTTYDPVKLSKSYLKDLIETNHLFLKMLEDYASTNRKIMIKVKGRKKVKKDKNKTKNVPKKVKKAKEMTDEELEETWTKMSEQVSAALEQVNEATEGEDGINLMTTENVIPFDAASDIPIDEQKDTALERISAFLHTGKLKEAVILLRACREVWPTETEDFGETGCSVSDELAPLKSAYVYQASTRRVLEARAANENGAVPQGSNEVAPEHEEVPPPAPVDEEEHERAAVIGDETDEDERGEEEDEEEEEEEQQANEREQEFDFKGFLLKYAMARVVCNYALLFQDWDSLKPLTLHCILKMFHRFVFDMGYPALLSQASMFLTWKKILEVADHRSDLKEAKGFFHHFWPKFVQLCNDKRMFVEILFWKTAREAQEIQDGYADYRGDGNTKKKKSDWTKDEENELELLVDLYKDSPEEVKKAQTLIAFIQERWTWRRRSNRAIRNKLLEKELVDPTELASKKGQKGRKPRKGKGASNELVEGSSPIKAPVSKEFISDESDSDSDNEVSKPILVHNDRASPVLSSPNLSSEDSDSDDENKTKTTMVINEDERSRASDGNADLRSETSPKSAGNPKEPDAESSSDSDEENQERTTIISSEDDTSSKVSDGSTAKRKVNRRGSPSVRKRAVSDDSDSDDGNKDRRTLIRSEDDVDSRVSDKSIVVKKTTKRAIINDSDSDEEDKGKTPVITNDDDESSRASEDSTITRKVTKRKRIVLEDSDDESNLSDSNQKTKKVVRTSATIVESDSE